MMVHHIGWQSDEPRAAVVTVFHRVFLGWGVAISRIYRKYPSGHTDVLQPVLTQMVCVAREGDANRQHQTLWAALLHNTLDPDVQAALWTHNDGNDPLAGFERIKTTPN
jgi:hypothetical protein